MNLILRDIFRKSVGTFLTIFIIVFSFTLIPISAFVFNTITEDFLYNAKISSLNLSSTVYVTDENGVYVFKNVPKGEYTYTELEAPEEYELDTNPHEIFVEGDRMVIEFPNTLKTGDINVVLLTIIALVSVVGISYITVKKINLSKNA